MLWVMPAPATAVAPWAGQTWNEMEPGPAAIHLDQSFWENHKQCQTHPAQARRLPPAQGLAAYLLGASQGEEQMQRCLGEVQVLLQAKAHLQGGEEGRQDREPAGHLQPRVTVLIHLTQLLGQVQAQDTHLLGPRDKDGYKGRSGAGGGKGPASPAPGYPRPPLVTHTQVSWTRPEPGSCRPALPPQPPQGPVTPSTLMSH